MLPNKLISFNESVFPKMLYLLSIISKNDISVLELLKKSKKEIADINDFFEALEILYVIGKINIEKGRINTC